MKLFYTLIIFFNLRWFPRVAEFDKWPFLPSHRDDNDDGDEYYPRIPKPYSVLFGPLNNGVYLHARCDSQRPRLVSVATSKFALCNVVTREYRFLNPFPSDMAALLSDLARNPCQLGYGFGSVHDEAGFVVDYKVVLILICWARGERFSRMLSFVYSLQRGSWDNIDVRRGMAYSATNKKAATALARLVNRQGMLDTPRSLFNLGATIQQQAFLNGSWHWLDVHSLGIKSRSKDRVLVFNVANERFRYFEGPPHDYHSLGDSRSPYEIKRGLFLLNAHLAVIYMPHDLSVQNTYRCLGFDVWMMMDYGIGGSWVKIYSSNTTFNNVSASFLGLRYSTCSSSSSSSISICIERVFIHDGYSEQLLSWDGSRVTEHGFYLQLRKEQVWNAIGISTYVETLDSLMLAP